MPKSACNLFSDRRRVRTTTRHTFTARPTPPLSPHPPRACRICPWYPNFQCKRGGGGEGRRREGKRARGLFITRTRGSGIRFSCFVSRRRTRWFFPLIIAAIGLRKTVKTGIKIGRSTCADNSPPVVDTNGNATRRVL